ncbi:MAG: hypothetical protein JWP29_5670 [Rhodoferax sp.]|nr:hypothetical protein [Rhodoferax sp.]
MRLGLRTTEPQNLGLRILDFGHTHKQTGTRIPADRISPPGRMCMGNCHPPGVHQFVFGRIERREEEEGMTGIGEGMGGKENGIKRSARVKRWRIL